MGNGQQHDFLLCGLASRHFAAQLAVTHHEHTIGHAKNFRQIRRCHQYRATIGGNLVDQLVNFNSRTDINPLVGSSSNSTFTFAIDHLPNTIFCWLPPDKEPAV